MAKKLGKMARMFELAQKKGTAKNITPEFIPWEKKGQTVLGQFISKNLVKSREDDKTYGQYLFKTDIGLAKFSMGGAADNEYAETMIPGNVYHITFEGQEKLSGKKKVNKFTVLDLGLLPDDEDDE